MVIQSYNNNDIDFCHYNLLIVLLPSGFLGQQVGLKGPAGIDLYLSIPWFAASISTVAGAIGAGLLNDELIKESTYGYRQRVRYEEQRR